MFKMDWIVLLLEDLQKIILPDKVRLNQRIRGVQGADWVHRMIPYWNTFIDELQQLSTDPRMLELYRWSSDSRCIKKG